MKPSGEGFRGFCTGHVPVSLPAALPRCPPCLGSDSSSAMSSPPMLRRSEGPAAGLYPVSHKRSIGIATEAAWPIGARMVRSVMEAPPHRSGIGCSGACLSRSLQRAGASWPFPLLVFRQDLLGRDPQVGGLSSSGRVVLRLNVSFQCTQLESRLPQTVTVLPDFLLGLPVPYLVKSSFGKNSVW